MIGLIEQVRLYSLANGGHAASAALAGIKTGHFIDIMAGRRPVDRQVASTFGPLIGVPAFRLLAADPDKHMLMLRGSQP